MAKPFTYKGAPKPFGKEGWFKESNRHALAAKGIRTGTHIHPLDYAGAPLPKGKPIPPPEPLTDEEKIAQAMEQQFHWEAGEAEVTEQDGHFLVKNGNEEYLVFESSDDAEEYALEQVKTDLEDDPSMFSQDWLEGHINMDNLKEQLEDGVTDLNRNYYDNIESESDNEWQNRCVSELMEKGHLDEEDFRAEDGELKEITPELQRTIDDAKDEAVEEMTEEQLSDPMEYLEGIYSKSDAVKEAIRIAGIDTDEAARDTVDTDGVARFLASYDGNETELPDGRVAYRI